MLESSAFQFSNALNVALLNISCGGSDSKVRLTSLKYAKFNRFEII